MKKITLLMACLLSVCGLYAVEYDHLYVIGDATTAGWTTSGNLEMTNLGEGKFTWTGELLDRGDNSRRFKFIVGNSWYPCLTTTADAHEVVTPGVAVALLDKHEEVQPDAAFVVEKTGTYKIDIDLNAMTMLLTETTQNVPDVDEFGQVYLAGSAFAEKVAMDKVSDGVYKWSGVLEVAEPMIGFYFESNDGTQSLNPANSGSIKSGVYNMVYNAEEVGSAEFQIPATSTYTITVDVANLSMEVLKIDYEHLYLVGSSLTARPGSWLTEDGVEMEKIESGKFTWSGQLYAQTTEGSNTEFKFLNQLVPGVWENDFVFDTTQSANQPIELGQTYTISYRGSGNDNKFTVPEDGNYKLTVDLHAMTLTVEEGTSSAINEVVAAAPAVVADGATVRVLANGLHIDGVMVFDLLGNCIASTGAVSDYALDLAHSGVYVVRIACGNQVYSHKVIVK